MTNLLKERQKTHGDFKDNARVSQALKRVIYSQSGAVELTEIQREALEMICLKIGRVLSGKPHFKDTWDDIAGYAMLAAKECGDE